jgi:hypothetical protein
LGLYNGDFEANKGDSTGLKRVAKRVVNKSKRADNESKQAENESKQAGIEWGVVLM